MGRKSHRQQLNVWMNGLLVGEWTLAHGEEIFAYHASWLNHPQTRPLSLSLPFLPNNAAHRGAVVNAYFDNLLPDSDIIRRRLAQHHRLRRSPCWPHWGAIVWVHCNCCQKTKHRKTCNVSSANPWTMPPLPPCCNKQCNRACQAREIPMPTCDCPSPARKKKPHCSSMLAAGNARWAAHLPRIFLNCR